MFLFSNCHQVNVTWSRREGRAIFCLNYSVLEGNYGPFLCPSCCSFSDSHCRLLSAYLEMNKILKTPVDSGWNVLPFFRNYWSSSSLGSEQFHPVTCIFQKPFWSFHSPHCRIPLVWSYLEWVIYKHTFQRLCIHHAILSFISFCPFPPPFTAPCMSCYTLFLHA